MSTDQKDHPLEKPPNEDVLLYEETSQKAVTEEPAVEQVQVTEQTAVRTPNATVLYGINHPQGKVEITKWSMKLPTMEILKFNNHLRMVKDVPVFSTEAQSSEVEAWKEGVAGSIENSSIAGIFQDRFYDQNSQFSQSLNQPNANPKGLLSPLRFGTGSGELTGEAALTRVARRLQLGAPVSVMLPHTGIVVHLQTPTEREIIDFYNSIFREKITMGRMTNGLTLSNHSVFVNNRLFDFLLQYVKSTNYSDIQKKDLKNYILLHDLPILAWAMAACLYPNGFQYERDCIADPTVCQHRDLAILNLEKLLWVDNASLTEKQKAILYEGRPNLHTAEVYRTYHAEHTRVTKRQIDLTNYGIRLHLKLPTVAEHVSDGLSWIDGINTKIETLLIPSDVDEGEYKTEILKQYVGASALRQFSHFVDYIEIQEDESEEYRPIMNRQDITKVLETLSGSDEARSFINEEIIKFKNDTVIALVGIPTYNCPNCKKPQEDPVNPHMSSVIPLDVMNVFFTLLTLRIHRILDR